jgi:hypothetical protein
VEFRRQDGLLAPYAVVNQASRRPKQVDGDDDVLAGTGKTTLRPFKGHARDRTPAI